MHAKTDSEATSIDATSSWAPRSPPRTATRPLYYVQSPSNHDVEKMSFGSGCSPMGSPVHLHYYHCSPIHHSRESSTSRFSDSLKPHRGALIPYKSLGDSAVRRRIDAGDLDGDGDQETDAGDSDGFRNLRLYVCLFLSLVLLFAVFSLILWATSKSYPPKIIVKGVVVENMKVQAGNDGSGVGTEMVSVKSRVKIWYRNCGTYFAVHVSSSVMLLRYYELSVASGEMKKFREGRKSERSIVTVVEGHQVPLYGAFISSHLSLPLNLTLVVRSRAYILGTLVTSIFYTTITCSFTLPPNNNTFPIHLPLYHSCLYHSH